MFDDAIPVLVANKDLKKSNQFTIFNSVVNSLAMTVWSEKLSAYYLVEQSYFITKNHHFTFNEMEGQMCCNQNYLLVL